MSHRERIGAGVAVAIALISGTVLILLFVAHNTKVVPASGGTYTEGVIGQPTFINPVLAESDVDKALVRLVFSNAADVATKIEPDKENRQWHLRIKEGLLWQDGQKVTSDDVIFTIQKIQDHNARSPLFSSWQGVTMQRLSELEVALTLTTPYAFLPNALRNLYIVPKHLFAQVPAANWRLSEYNLKPIGNGPYYFSGYEKNTDGFITTYTLKSNPTYHSGEPLIRTLLVHFSANAQGLIKDFNSGRTDGFLETGHTYDKDIKRPYQSTVFTMPRYYAVFLNQSKNNALSELPVRKALQEAINKSALVEALFGDGAHVTNGPLPASATGDTEPTSFSLDDANATLEAAGWQMNGDGIREKSDKKTISALKFALIVPEISFLVDTATSLKNSWKQIGVSVDITVKPSSEIVRNTIKNRDYEMLLFGNILGSSLDPFSFWHSSERFYPGLNIALYNNKTVDTLIESLRQHGSQDGTLFQDINRRIADDIPAIFLYSPSSFYLTTKAIKGMGSGTIFDPADRFANISHWYLNTSRVLK